MRDSRVTHVRNEFETGWMAAQYIHGETKVFDRFPLLILKELTKNSKKIVIFVNFLARPFVCEPASRTGTGLVVDPYTHGQTGLFWSFP